jgi:hypothetical protein
MSILGQVREPIIPPPQPSSTTLVAPIPNHVVPSAVADSQDQFDSYLNKLQTICSENDRNKAAAAAAGCYPNGVHHTTPPPPTALQPYNTSAKI